MLCTVAMMGTAVVLLPPPTAASPKQAAEAAPAVATIKATARATSAIAAGAIATFDVSLINLGPAGETGPTSGPGAGDAAAPVTFTVTGLPDGATFDAATSTSPISEWACTPAAGGGVCTLVAKGTTQPTPLLGGDSAGAELEVHVPASASITGPVVAHVTAHAADGATAPDLTQASVDLPVAALQAGQAGSLGITATTPPVVQVRRTSTGTITVRNLGPATIGGAGAPVQLTGLVPAAALQPYATGTGWKCKGLPLACQWAGDPIPVGGSLPPVTVGYTAPNTPTPADTPYEVTRTATAAVIAPGEIKPQGAATGTQLVEVSISPHPAPAVAVTARPVGSAGVEAPGQIKTEVAVTAASVDEKAQAIVVKASAPTGISFASVASSGPWRCASSAGAATCTRPGALAQGARSSFVLTWNVSAAAPAKGASVHVAASVAGEAAATLGDNQADVAYQITKAPVPTVSLRIWHYPASQPAIRQDGRLLRIATGTPTRFGIDAVNDGSATIPAGTDVKLSLQLPPGARTMTSTDLGAPAWRCRTAPTSSPKGTALVCTLRLLRAVTAGRALPRLRTYVTLPSNATVGVGHWYVRLSASQAGHPIPSLTTTTHKGVTVVRAPKLAAKPNLTMKLARAPRRTGRTGYLSVTFGNAGNAAAPSAFVLVSLPPGLRTTLPYPTGCARAPAGMAPVRAVCQIPAGLAPGKTTTRTLRITATSEAAPKGTARAEGRLGHGAPVEATTTVVALQPIDAKAHATPADVTSPAAGQPGAPVVLDGRTSVAVDATASWKQLRAPGDPAVTFKDVAAGSTRVDDLTARFATPVVTKTTKLHFLLTVTDGATSDATTVTVVVRPVPKLSTETDLGWGDPSQKDQATTSNSSADSYLWGWSTYPTVTRWNDVGYDSGPVFGSRIHFVAGADTPEAIWHGAEDQVPTVHSTQAFLVLCDTPHGDEGNSCDWPYPVGSLDRTITDPSARWAVRYQVIWTDSGGTDHTSWEDFPLMLRPGQWAWSWTIDVAPVPITDPGVSGSPSVGHLLTAHQGTWSLEFGFSYQWIRCTPGDAASCTDIPDATGATYEVQAADKGFELGVRVTADGLPVEEGGMGFTGTATAMVHPAVQDCATSCWTNDTPPTVSSTGAGGALVAGYPVTITDVGTWTWLDPANPPQDTTTTQGWRTCSATTPSDCTTTTGATYTPQVPGTTVTATVTRSSVNPATGTRVATVAEVPLGAVGAPAAPPALLGDPADQPAIQGDPTVGSTLTAFAGHWTYSLLRGGSDLDIAWYRCDTAPTPSCTDLHWSGPTYLVSAADQLATSHRLQVRVTAHGIDAAHDTTVASSPSGIVTATEKRLIAAPSFTAAGPFQVGTTLTRTPGTWSADPAASGPTVQWQRCTDIATPTCLNISGATSDTYTLATSDVGKWIRLREAYQSAGVPNPTYGHSDVAATQPVAPAQVALGVTLDPDSITLDLGASQTITAAATGGTAPYTYEWTHLGPSSVTSTSDGASITVTAPATGSGTATFTVTVTDDAGATASKTLTVDYHDLGAQVPPILCQLQTAVEVHGTTFALGTGMQLSIGGATASSGACGTGTTVDIANPHIELFGDITIAAQSVHIDTQGAHFTNVTLHVNDRALEGSNFSAASDLHITFAADDSQSSSIEVSGSVFADGIPFVQLPGGWRTREQVKFSVSGGSQSIELHAIAFPSANPLPTQHAGDPLPTPPEGAASVHLDGTFSYDQEHGAKLHLDAGTTNLIQVGNGAAINLTASFDRTPEEPVSFTASGSLSAPLELAPGARLAAADLE
ncbi:MAG: hypothetical protein U0P45_03355 [Acidimicrobiales bacterium]